ncbi:MAG TPA: DUF2723 domain-containing protein [Patescibacteria group bacterium]|nr:DUF2723 domain-containing protein [Patescibacteria group bacterium]
MYHKQVGQVHGRKSGLPVTLPIVFVATLTIYLSCAAPSIMYGDSAELQAVALEGGVAHPTGYPTFILLGQVFGRVLGGDEAHRITAMSAIFGAAAVCAFLVVLLKFGLPLRAATAGAVIYALSFTFFWSAIRTEVYTVAIFIFFVGLWLTLHALERPVPARAALAGLFLGLVLTGHLTFVPPVMVMLVALILARPTDGGSRAKYIAALAVAFTAGLLPYLYLVYADRAGYALNYLDFKIDPAGGQYGLTPETFDDPWERIPWLILGTESQPTVFLVHLRPMIWQIQRVLSIEFIYHFGPVALPLFVLGIHQAARRLHRRVLLLLAIILASALFGAGFGVGRMLQIFLIPSTIGIAVTVSFGIWFILERIPGDSRQLRWIWHAMLIVLVLCIVLVPHALRVRLQDSPSFPDDMKMHVEGEPEIRTFIPRLNDFWEPRRYGERVLDLVPENAFVAGKWKEITVLYYLHYVEGARPDITLDEYVPGHYIRLNRWQEKHGLATHPIVFLRHPSVLQAEITNVDTLRVNDEQSLFICRKPFEPLLPPARRP